MRGRKADGDFDCEKRVEKRQKAINGGEESWRVGR
jgi:hypothetical protein